MWLQRPMTRVLLLAGAAGGPYLLYNTQVGQQILGATQNMVRTESPSGEDVSSGFWNANGVELKPEAEPSSLLPEQPIHALQEILRFDVSPAWVIQRFPRVTTLSSELQFDAMRVPLVTGTAVNDLAGSLTYYFDAYQRVQRITVHAVTGDPTRFVGELQHVYRMQQRPALGGALYVHTWNGQPTSVAFVAPAPVITQADPQNRFNVFIELNRPGLQYGLSEEAQELITAGRQTQRW